MQRRAALIGLACGCCGTALPSQGRAAAALAGHALAWGPDGTCVARPDGALQCLPDGPASGTRPALTACGLWLANAQGALRGWAPDAAGVWQLRHGVELGAPVHAFAASPDGCWLAAAHGARLSLLGARGQPMASFGGTDLARTLQGPATALFSLPQRRSFAAVWPALGEVWEISTDPEAAPLFDGLVHDYRMGEAIAKPGYLGARRAPLGRPLPGFNFADARVPWLAGAQGAEVVVLHLDVRRRIAALPADGANPAGATLRRTARAPAAFEWWLPAGRDVHVFDTARWRHKTRHTLPGTVQQLQAVDDTVASALWALVGERDDAALWRLVDEADGWHPVPGCAGRLRCMNGGPPGAGLWVLRRAPSALLHIDSDGVLRALWPLPDTRGGWQGIAAWPLA